MPRTAPRPCTYPGCSALAASGGSRCVRHVAQQRRELDQRRGSSNDRGYGSAWQKARARYLCSHPLCVLCERDGRVTAATVVDHVVPHRGDRALFWDSANWQPLCKPHHDAKTASEDGGLGNARGAGRIYTAPER